MLSVGKNQKLHSMQSKIKENIIPKKLPFYNTVEKKMRTVSVYSLYKEFISEGFVFSSDVGIFTVKLINDANHIT